MTMDTYAQTTLKFRAGSGQAAAFLKYLEAESIPYGLDQTDKPGTVLDGWMRVTVYGDVADKLAAIGHELGLPMRGYTEEVWVEE